MFTYANAECTGSRPMSAYVNAHTARLENMIVFVCICWYKEQTVRFPPFDSCVVTQIETMVTNCNKNYFVWRSLHSHNRAFLSAYKHIGFHVSNTCAVYMGSRARGDESTHYAAMLKGQASEPTSKTDWLLNTNQITADYGQWQRWVPIKCGCYGQGILWRNFTGTTFMIAASAHSMFQWSCSTQPRFT